MTTIFLTALAELIKTVRCDRAGAGLSNFLRLPTAISQGPMPATRNARSIIAVLVLWLLLPNVAYVEEIHFPVCDVTWERTTASIAGFTEAGLDAVFRYAFEHNTSELVVTHFGRLVREERWDGADTPGDVASVQKSVVAVLVGIAQSRGLLNIDDPVSEWLGDSWTKAELKDERKITIKHLLSMNSGLTGHLDREFPPGFYWRYNTRVYQYLKRVLEKASGMSHEEITEIWLTRPIGMKHTTWRLRPTMQYPDGAAMTGLFTNGRDMARLGIMILAGGLWGNKSIIDDREYLSAMLTPSQEDNPAYGYLWWINGHLTGRLLNKRTGQLVPDAPDDLVAALGIRDQKIYVVPSLGLVVTRRGETGIESNANTSSFDNELWHYLMAARVYTVSGEASSE